MGTKEVLPVFQDAIYHYCLNLNDCQKGKELMCNKVGRSDSDYPDPTLRRRLIQQCKSWRIPVKFARQGDITAHYVYFHN